MTQTRTILGLNVDIFPSYEAVCAFVRDRVEKRQRTLCVAMNPEKVCRARRDPELRRILQSAELRICDGVGLSLASRILHGSAAPRCTGVDLFMRLVALAEKRRWSVFLLGASPESNQGARRELMRLHPALRIAGSRDGFFKDPDAVIGEINRSGADLLFVAMGSPRQEFWIGEHRARLAPLFCMGVGGTFDVLAGVARRAPAIFRNTGTEWLFRLASDPRRLRRQLVLPAFAWQVFKSAFTQ